MSFILTPFTFWELHIIRTEYGPEVAFAGIDDSFNTVWYRLPYDYESHAYSAQRIREQIITCEKMPTAPLDSYSQVRVNLCNTDGTITDSRIALIDDMRSAFYLKHQIR